VDSSRVLFETWSAALGRQPDEISALRARQLTSLGELLQYSQRRDAADSAFRRALTMRRAVYGGRHPQVASSLLDLALLSSRGAEADSLSADAVTLLRASYPEGHPQLANALRSRGVILQRLGRHADALGPLREALGVRRRVLGANSVDVARTELDLSLSLTMTGAGREAEALGRDAERIYRLALGSGSAMVDVARQRVGDALRLQGRYAEAEPILLAVYKRFETPRPITREWRAAALRSLVSLYEAQGSEAEAAKYRTLLP
jgi:serine/threonine-protein kinase